MLTSRALRHPLSGGVSIRKASTLVTKVNGAVAALPHREAARYEEKNYKLTASHIVEYADSHGKALLDYRLKAGDTLGLWLADSAEKHITMLAAAMAGLKVVDIDPTITDIPSIRKFLQLSDCKILYFWPTRNNINYPMLLRKAIPEFYHYDNTMGQHFHSKYYQNLKYFVHFGFDNEFGCLTYHEIRLPNPKCTLVAEATAKLSDDAPLSAKITKSSEGQVIMSPWVTHKQALDHPSWTFAKKLVDQEFYEVALA